ncbi:hypothetical protein FOL47_002220 [Perkinsus chesapeaki]|uniref:Uncharacterized protein n=1 Tax=Perkinsus chesapeaki TaxID=330153 RepID=A0A7J6MET4_PERCH|nr:hypothetical protein FOL47_002220 [Perkinsus chesapeaki]
MKFTTVNELSADARRLHSMAGKLFGLDNTYEIRRLVETLATLFSILNRLEREEGTVRSLKAVSRHDAARMAELEEEYEGMAATVSSRTTLGPEQSLIKVYECWGDML